MSFFIGVIFACVNNSCIFLKPKENFDSRKRCEAAVLNVIRELKAEADIVDGSCLLINFKEI